MSKTKAILRRALSGCLLLLFTVNLSSQAPESGAGDAKTEGISPNTAEAILDRAPVPCRPGGGARVAWAGGAAVGRSVLVGVPWLG